MPARYHFIFLLLCLALPLSGQELPRVLNFSRADYASQNQNWAITQGTSGTMFFANNAGLLEFDGSRWRTFLLPDGQTVRAVAYFNGRLYVGGFAEFGFFELDSAIRWYYHSLSSLLQSDKVRREEIWHILVRQGSGDVFFQSFSTIYKYDGAKTAEVIPPANLMFLENASDGVYFQGIGNGLFELLEEGGFRFVKGSETLANTIVVFIVPQKDGGLLVGTRNDGIFLCSKGDCRPWANPLNKHLKALQPNKAARLADGGLAIGTVLSGVFILDSLENLRFHLDRENGLQNNTVLAMHTDQAGNLWLGLDKGIDLVELNSPLTWFFDLSGKIGAVYSAALHENKLYVGTNQGVFYKNWNPLEKQDNEFSLVPGTQGQVWQLQVFDNQLVCGHNEGTFLIKNTTARKISDVTGGWVTQRVPGRSDVLLQGTYTGLVVFVKKQAGEWAFGHRVEGFNEAIKEMAFDKNGALWLVHPNRGLWRVRLDASPERIDEIRRFTTEDGLPTDFNLGLSQFDNHLMVKSGNHYFEAADNRLAPVSLPDYNAKKQKVRELASGAHFDIYKDQVTHVNEKGVTSFPLSLISGFETIIELSPGMFLFCLENGYTIWNNRKPFGSNKRHQNELAISAVEVLSDPPQWFYPAGADGLWETAANKNNLRLYLTQPDFTHRVKFRWSLSGAIERLAESEVDFIELTALLPGEYLLEVSTTEEGDAASFRFSVLPPWWQTWWAMLIWLALAAILIWLVEKFNHRRLRKQREHLQTEKERELAAQRMEGDKERLQAEVDNKTRELSNATINLIRKNETLLALRDELGKVELPRRDHGRLDRLIENHLSGDQDWEIFEEAFNQVHDEFFKKLKNRFPELTPGDLRLAAFLKLNLSSKEIASLLGISVRGVENKRYRLRKKMGLSENDNLSGLMMEA